MVAEVAPPQAAGHRAAASESSQRAAKASLGQAVPQQLPPPGQPQRPQPSPQAPPLVGGCTSPHQRLRSQFFFPIGCPSVACRPPRARLTARTCCRSPVSIVPGPNHARPTLKRSEPVTNGFCSRPRSTPLSPPHSSRLDPATDFVPLTPGRACADTSLLPPRRSLPGSLPHNRATTTFPPSLLPPVNGRRPACSQLTHPRPGCTSHAASTSTTTTASCGLTTTHFL